MKDVIASIKNMAHSTPAKYFSSVTASLSSVINNIHGMSDDTSFAANRLTSSSNSAAKNLQALLSKSESEGEINEIAEARENLALSPGNAIFPIPKGS